jgi:hypothetical protein
MHNNNNNYYLTSDEIKFIHYYINMLIEIRKLEEDRKDGILRLLYDYCMILKQRGANIIDILVRNTISKNTSFYIYK